MTAVWMLALLALAGGLGAGARFILDGVIRQRTSSALPLGTVTINLLGSLLLGLLTGLVGAALLPVDAQFVLGAGLLGGFTTFSTASVEAVRLAERGRGLSAAATAVLPLLAGVALAAIGLVLGTLVAAALTGS